MNRSDYMIGIEAVDHTDQRSTPPDTSSITDGTISKDTSLITTVGVLQQPQLRIDHMSSDRAVYVERTASARCQLKQIEFNTMAAGAAGLAVKVNSLHRSIVLLINNLNHHKKPIKGLIRHARLPLAQRSLGV